MPQAYIDIDIGPNAAEDVWISSVIHVSAMVILYYDYMLTLNREIELLWPPHNKQGWATTACLLNRYISVLGYLPLVVSFFIPLDFPLFDRSCVGLHAYFECLMTFAQFVTGILCLIRVYAIYSKSRRILGFLAFTGGISLVVSAGAILASHYKSGNVIPVLSSFVGCSQFTPSSKGRFYDIAWVGVSFFDSVIFSLTLYRAYELGGGIRPMDVIVRDGAMYFSVLFIINLGNVFNLQFSPHLLRSSTSTVTNVLSSTLVSRLVLNLREQKVALAQQLPTTIETEHRFQAALPVARESLVVENLPSFHPNNSIDETVMIGTFGMS
ncbi:hypothetical protein BC827DRAFT_1273858 [Russula dissimulans]|nr:hypothetical protein BC827DRAFT_1273858 [Russula dissimulans]